MLIRQWPFLRGDSQFITYISCFLVPQVIGYKPLIHFHFLEESIFNVQLQRPGNALGNKNISFLIFVSWCWDLCWGESIIFKFYSEIPKKTNSQWKIGSRHIILALCLLFLDFCHLLTVFNKRNLVAEKYSIILEIL